MELRRKRHIATTLIATILLTIGVAVLAATDETSPPVSYIFSTIDLPNAKDIFGATGLGDINERGTVVGGFVDSSGPSFLLTRDITRTNVDCLGSPTTSSGSSQAINRHGGIAGICNQGGRLHGFFRRPNGKVVLLDVPGATLTEATGINDFNQIVGDYRDAQGQFHGFFWDNGLFLTFDVPFPGARSTGPSSINNVGQITGSYLTTTHQLSSPTAIVMDSYMTTDRFPHLTFLVRKERVPLTSTTTAQSSGFTAVKISFHTVSCLRTGCSASLTFRFRMSL